MNQIFKRRNKMKARKTQDLKNRETISKGNKEAKATVKVISTHKKDAEKR